jgi:hypothetical protein
MSQLSIHIEDDRKAFLPGEFIRGAVRWQCPDYPKTAALRLFWYTQGRGTEDILLIDEVAFDNPTPSAEESFEFKLPVGPYSFSGSLISLIWALELEVGRDCIRTEFTLSPTGKEILLQAAKQ